MAIAQFFRFHSVKRRVGIPVSRNAAPQSPLPKRVRQACIGPSPPWWISLAMRVGGASPKALVKIHFWARRSRAHECVAFKAPTTARRIASSRSEERRVGNECRGGGGR